MPTRQQVQSPKIEAEVKREDEHTQGFAADSARAQSLFDYTVDKGVSKFSVHSKAESDSSQPRAKPTATKPTIFASSTPVVQHSDISLQHLVSAASVSDHVGAATSAVAKPDGPVSLKIAEKCEMALESIQQPRTGTSAAPDIGFVTPPVSNGVLATPEASDAVNCNPEEILTVDNTPASKGPTPIKITYPATSDDMQAERGQIRNQLAELLRETRKQETIVRRYDRRIKEQDEEIADQLQDIKEMKASQAETDRKYTEALEQVKAQHRSLLAQKDSEFGNLNGEVLRKDETIAQLRQDRIERENWILEMERSSNKKNRTIRSLQQQFVELVEKLGNHLSEEELGN
jgi:hypothetical protein